MPRLIRIQLLFLRQVTIYSGRKRVQERRPTAWQTAHDADLEFSYSGKTMRSRTGGGYSPSVAGVAKACERVATYDLGWPVNYDGVLLNLYPDGNSGIKFHEDPDQGTVWAPTTCVASIGDTRKFCFKSQTDPEVVDLCVALCFIPHRRSLANGQRWKIGDNGTTHEDRTRKW